MMTEAEKDAKIAALEPKFAAFMEEMGLDLRDTSLHKTPYRIAKMFVRETCAGLYEEPPLITTFPNEGENHYGGIVLVKDIEIKSLCEHHFQPFVGKCWIAYIPKERIIGLSKFSRVANYFARRPQVQERLTKQIYNHLQDILDTDDIAVVVDCEHFCMKLRGVEEPCASTATAVLGGVFHDDPRTRQEFYKLIEMGK